MRIRFITLALLTITYVASGQHAYFPMGQVTLADLDLKIYDADTAAASVVMREFGYAYISNDDNHHLVYEYHVKIKILKKEGFTLANFSVPLRKSDGREEKWLGAKAATYNLENGAMVVSHMDTKGIYKSTRSQYMDEMRFTLPDIRIGSVLDVMYQIESPFIFNFREWPFQSEYPKMVSEFWASIPGNYQYNISLKGPLKLSGNESSILKNCLTGYGQASADCAFLKYRMEKIPAFKEEEYMTAKSNFLSAITFELVEVKSFDGRVFKYTREWKDVEEELRTHADFGIQIKKAKNLFDDLLPQLLAGITDEKERALKLYRFVSSLFDWNGYYGKYADQGIRKAYETKKGNIGDINLTLIAIFQEAGFESDPVLLSTRDNGLPGKLYPVLSDFNYVVARVKVNNEFFLVDASDPFLPFGVLPERCLNGQGRLISKNSAEWVDLAPRGKQKRNAVMTLALDGAGVVRGKVEVISYEYEAAQRRRKIVSYASEKENVKDLEQKWGNLKITDYLVTDLADPDKALKETMNVELKAFENMEAGVIFLDPHFLGKWNENPFKSSERLFPVDFGAPLETLTMVSLEYPKEFQVDELPGNSALALPASGGRYAFSVTDASEKLSVVSRLQINKSLYSPEEYYALRELFARVISSQSALIVLKKR
jgi:hypothetical protein